MSGYLLVQPAQAMPSLKHKFRCIDTVKVGQKFVNHRLVPAYCATVSLLTKTFPPLFYIEVTHQQQPQAVVVATTTTIAKDYCTWSIITTLFCCFWIGIAAIIKSQAVRDANMRGTVYAEILAS